MAIECTAGSLAELSACFTGLSPKQQAAISNYLLCQIANNGGGNSGSVQTFTGAFADPTGNVTPDDPTIANTYYQDINPPLNVWYWSVTDQAWHQHSG